MKRSQMSLSGSLTLAEKLYIMGISSTAVRVGTVTHIGGLFGGSPRSVASRLSYLMLELMAVKKTWLSESKGSHTMFRLLYIWLPSDILLTVMFILVSHTVTLTVYHVSRSRFRMYEMSLLLEPPRLT